MSKPAVPIAIIGMSCHFAGGATDPEKLWELCAEGRTGWSEIPDDRFNIDGHYHPRPDNLNTTNVKGACFLDEDIGNFDATFFNLPAETAACLDPQFRLMLEGTYEAFENAGLTMDQVFGSNTSVYAGSFFKDYHDSELRDVTTLPRFFLVGVGSAMASNRLSHYFDLRGASMSIDAGCSTTLTALHQACNDLRNHESDMSVVSGANLMLNPDMFITMSSIALISKDGRSFAFDSRANGYGRGEGAATIVLKRLDDAIRDGDPIQCVIKETGLNQDGKTETITTPSQAAQIELMRRVYKKAGLDPKDTGYFEAHGTGTPTGDPLEPNVGHTECASGLASIVKVVKAIEKGLIPPAANLKTINPKLKLGEWNLKIPRTTEPWNSTLRRASVNNFGYGGANSHVILENYTPTYSTSVPTSSLPSRVYLLSAKDEHAAETMVSNLRDHLIDVPDSLSYQNDLSYTLGERRSAFPWVAATSASSISELIRLIDAGKMKPKRRSDPPKLGFVFTGQGAQWWAMGRELISAYPVFRETLHEADVYLREFGATWSLIEELGKTEETTRVNEAALGQPVCVAVQIALVRLLESWGVRPTAVSSHSSGEIASAYAAGVFSLRSAMGVVYARGTLAADVAKFSNLGQGGMMAVGLGVDNVQKYVDRVTAGRIVVACQNSPSSVTISGDISGIQELEMILKAEGVFARKLQVPAAYHSHHMEPLAKPYADWLNANIKPESQMSDIIYSSPTTGQRMSNVEEIGSAEHWIKSLTQPVLFVESFTNMCFSAPGEPSAVDMVVELGAHPALSGPIQDITTLDAIREKTDYRIRVSPSDVYDSMHRVGIQHGPIFQNLKAVQVRPQGSLATIQTVDTRSIMPYQFEHSHIIHPTTLDTVFQAIYAALPAARANLPSAQVPPSIKNLSISEDIKRGCPATLNAFSEVQHHDKQGFRAAVTVTDGDEGDVVITIKDFLFQSIGDSLSKREPCENDKFLTPKWVSHLGMMKADLLQQLLAGEPDVIQSQALADTNLVWSWLLKDALAAMAPEEVYGIRGQFNRYYASMKGQAVASQIALLPQDEKAALIKKVAAGSANGKLMCAVAPHLVDILCRRVPQLESIQDNQLLQRFYDECGNLDRSRKQVAELVRLYALQHPRAKILEIKAGSGATTYPILNALGIDDPLCASYDFTDSSDDFEVAEKYLVMWKNVLSFRNLDIEQDPSLQGFEAGTYDLIIASQAFKKATSMDTIMENVQKLLKPGGNFLMIERTHDRPDFRMMFGLLSDRCLNDEEDELLTPSVAVDAWNDALLKNGFTGIDVVAPDYNRDEDHSYSVLMSSKVTMTPSYHPEVVIAVSTLAAPQDWLESLTNAITAITNSKPMVQAYDNLDCEGKIVVFLPEVSTQLLVDPGNVQFSAIKNACTRSKGMLWVTRGGAMESDDPFSSLASGFLRILRLEYSGKLLATLDLDSSMDAWSASTVSTISNFYANLFNDAAEKGPRDFEFAERNGVINVLRYFKDHERNKVCFPDAAEANTTVLQKFNDNSLQLTVENPGHLDSLVFVPSLDQSNIDMAPDELEICPQAFGLTPRDIGAATNTLQDRALGFECAGTVTQVGALASLEGYKVGDRVAVLMNGEFGNRIRVPWTGAVQIPSAMSFELAAALPLAYATAWISLMDVARIKKGDTILVHDAGSAVGQAAISLAKFAGAEIFATVNDMEHGSFLRRVIGIKADHIFSSADSTFAAAIRQKTKGRGVDIVLNTLEASLLHETLECVAPLGHFFELGKRDMEQSSRLDMGAFARGITFSAIDITIMAKHKGHQVHQALTSALELMKARKIGGVSVSVHDISNVVQAFRNAQSSGSLGTVVLSIKPDSMVPVIRQVPRVKLHSNASYVVVGGFGGIGQSICLWLAEHGARNLIVLSRSANAADKATPLINHLHSLDCQVRSVACDITNEDDVLRAVESSKDMAPVRGVIQGAMVLRDSILEQMSLTDYTTGLRPKVQGTWNLHKAFEATPLDFFVILSSIAGIIGIASQCNYGAGGAFQDALAAHRTSRGLPCVSIDIGAVKNVGYVAEHDEMHNYLKKQGHMVLSEGDVLKSLACAINAPFATQLVFGINTAPSSALWDEGPASRDLRFWPAKFRSTGNESANTGATDTLAGRIAMAKSLEEAAAAVAAEITAKIMEIFMIPEAEVFPNKPMAEFGVDSLTAVELRNTLATKADAEVSIFDIMQSPSLTAIALSVAGRSAHLSPALIVAA